MGNLYAPNGRKIVGTSDIVPATAYIESGSVEKNDAGYGFVFLGESEIDWDNQTTQVWNGQSVYIDDDGNEWIEDELEFRDE